MIKATVNQSIYEVKEGTTLSDLAKQVQKPQEPIILLAYMDGKVVGRIDSAKIYSRFDGSVKAYLDWICVIKSYRHKGVAQMLLKELRRQLKKSGVETLIALTDSNEAFQRFYRKVPNSEMKNTGIWIDII